jgi:hypothetical protein
MDQKISELLWELKCAIDQALWNSDRISATIAALKHAGQGVQIAIDAALVDYAVPAASSPVGVRGQPGSGGLLELSATDLLFLRALKISVETA